MIDMDVKKLTDTYKLKTSKLKSDIESLNSLPNDESKYKQLIKLTTAYERFVKKVESEGVKIKSCPAYMTSTHWKTKYKKITKTKTKPKTKKPTTQNQHYALMLCWTIKPDCCVCESIVKKIKDYFTNIGITMDDTTRTDFPDRVEFCESYIINCNKEKYDLILKSAEYILDISTNSIYDKCNIGLYGKII